MALLKNIAISILIVEILGGILLVPLAYIDYNLRKDYIAKVLCIQRDVPDNSCEGQCYLAKKLKRTSNQHNEQPQQLVEQLQFSIFNQPIQKVAPEINRYIQKLTYSSNYLTKISNQYVADIFHPPRFLR